MNTLKTSSKGKHRVYVVGFSSLHDNALDLTLVSASTRNHAVVSVLESKGFELGGQRQELLNMPYKELLYEVFNMDASIAAKRVTKKQIKEMGK